MFFQAKKLCFIERVPKRASVLSYLGPEHIFLLVAKSTKFSLCLDTKNLSIFTIHNFDLVHSCVKM